MEPEEIKPETHTKSTIDAVTGLVKAVPVYQDAVQPAAKQVGKSLETVSKTINIALAPIKVLVWGYDKIEEFITKRISEKLENVPEENIITPPPQVAGPAIEALRYSGHDEQLRELYANLLANAMNKETTIKAHPSFVEIIKNLTSDEALLLQHFRSSKNYPIITVRSRAKKDGTYEVAYRNFSYFHIHSNIVSKELIPAYIDNLCRLGLVQIPVKQHLSNSAVYSELESAEEMCIVKSKIENSTDSMVHIERCVVCLTEFGEQFINVVVT